MKGTLVSDHMLKLEFHITEFLFVDVVYKFVTSVLAESQLHMIV